MVIDAATMSPAAHEASGRWCSENGIVSGDTYRIEIDPATMQAVVFQYARNNSGQLFMDPIWGNVAKVPATRPPFTVTLKTLPPWVTP